MNRRRLVIPVVLVASLLVGGAAVSNRVLGAIGGYLVTEDPLRPADAIAVLIGSFPDRVLEAVDLYREGYAPLVVLTRSQPPPGFDELTRRGIVAAEPHELNRNVLLQLGVPDDAIAVLPRLANSTVAEMRALHEFLLARDLRSVVLVTSRYHTTRSVGLLREVSGGSLSISARPTRYDSFQPGRWWKSRTDATYVFYEYSKMFFHSIHTLVDTDAPDTADR